MQGTTYIKSKMFRLQESVAFHFQLGPVALTVCVFGVPLPDDGRFLNVCHTIKNITSDIEILLKVGKLEQ